MPSGGSKRPTRQPVRRSGPYKRIAPVSKRRQSDQTAYRDEARAFVKAAVARGEKCPVVECVEELKNGRRYGWPVSAKLNEVHHRRGRAGKLLRDQRYWTAVSKAGHQWIHSNPAAAREMGWLCAPGEWGKQ